MHLLTDPVFVTPANPGPPATPDNTYQAGYY